MCVVCSEYNLTYGTLIHPEKIISKLKLNVLQRWGVGLEVGIAIRFRFRFDFDCSFSGSIRVSQNPGPNRPAAIPSWVWIFMIVRHADGTIASTKARFLGYWKQQNLRIGLY